MEFQQERSVQRMSSQHEVYEDPYSSFSDDDLTDESLSGRESVASSCLETELEFEHFQEPPENTSLGNKARMLYLQACESMGVVPIKRLLQQLCSDEIRITHRNLNDTDCKAISNPLLVNKTVTTLDLSNNLITDKGVLYLASAMVERDLVRVLVLAGNKLAYNSAEIFAELLQRSKSLAILDLSCNNIDDKASVVLAEALKSNKTLQECNLSHNKLSENAGIALAEALTYNTTLQRLNLSWNYIRRGVVSIATALSTNQTLRIFDLSWNGIDDLGIRALVEGLEINTAMEELNLSRNNISDSGFLELVKVLEKSRLQKLDISRNSCFGLNKALEMLLRLLLDEKTDLKVVNIGQMPLTKETTQLLAELKTKADVNIYHGYTTQDSYQAIVPKQINPCKILKDYAITNQLHSFQFFRALGQSNAYREAISSDELTIGLRGLGVFDDDQIKNIIHYLDRDRNGLIDYSEFMTIFACE